MAEIKKYLDTTALGTLVDQIKNEDAKGLQSAKDYADSLAKNYDATGSAASALADAKAYTDELANGQVATNKADIAKLNGDVNTEGSVAKAVADAKALVDADVDAVESIANKNKEDIAAINNAENGILAQAKADATEKANAVQESVNTLAGKVGEVPADQTVMGIITNIQESAYDDTELKGLISGLETNKADKTQVATDIAAAVKVEEEARIVAVNGVQGNIDTLSQTHAADKTALEGAIALKADKTALDEVSAVANAAAKQTDLEAEVNRAKGEESRIEGLVTAEVERATKAEKTNADAIKVISDDYLKAADKTELQGNIDVVTGKVTTLIGEDADKSVRTIANEELAKQLVAENAAESLDTLAEIAAWIQSHPEDASAMNKAIDDLETLVGTLPEGVTATNVVDYIAEVQTAVQAEIDRLDAEKQDVITEGSVTSGVKTVTLDDAYDTEDGDFVLSPDVITISDITSLSMDGTIKVWGGDGNPENDVETEITFTGIGLDDFTKVEEWGCLYYESNDGISPLGRIEIYADERGITLLCNDANVESLTLSYNSTVKSMVVKKEHLPSDIVYQDAIDGIVSDLNTSNEELNTEISKKADKTTVEGIDGRLTIAEDKVSTLEGKVTTVEGAVAKKVEQSVYDTKVLELEGVDTSLDERIAALEAKHGDGEGTVESLIATAKAEAISEAGTNADTKDEVVLASAKSYTDEEIDKVEGTISTLQGVVDGKAAQSDVDTLSGKVTTVEGKVSTLETEMDAVQLLADTADKAAKANAQALLLKASQEDLDKAVARIATNEGAISTINTTLADKAEQDDLDAAVARIAANETAIASNTSKINSFTPITSSEVEALFA